MQEIVNQFNNNKMCHSEPMPPYARLFDVGSEMGELIKEYLKSSHYGTQTFKVTEDFKMEFGDVMYALLSLANELNISAEECVSLVIKKYEKRIKDRGTMGSNK